MYTTLIIEVCIRLINYLCQGGLEGGRNIWPPGELMLAEMFGPRLIKCFSYASIIWAPLNSSIFSRTKPLDEIIKLSSLVAAAFV